MPRSRESVWLCAAVILLAGLTPGAVLAGMPSASIYGAGKVITLSEHAEWRLQGISFFLAGVLLSALVFKGIWNYLAGDFKFLPKIGYCGALGAIVLWGLLFVLVLTMISGARELMTPGAWKLRGATYELRTEEPPAPAAKPEPAS